MKTPELTGESATINASDGSVIDLAGTALELTDITLRSFAEAAADAATDFDDTDSVPILARKDATNWKRGTAVYDASTPKLTATWTTVKGAIATSDPVDVFVSRGEELHLDAAEIVSGTLADARVAESNVTQHEAALTLSTGQVTAAGALMDSEVDADIKTLSLPASTTISAFGATVIDDADAATARTTLGLAIGTDVQAHSGVLDATTASFLIADATKLDSIEPLADVTDAVNVDAAGAVMESDVDAKGDVFVATADNTLTRLAVGADGQVLTADEAEAGGVKWADAAGGGDVVDDTTPQLGGNLDLNAFQITGAGETVTANKPLLDISQTWNDGAIAFDFISGAITNTASDGGSSVIRVSDGASNVLWVSANGEILFNKSGGASTQYRGMRANPTYANLLEFVVGVSGFGITSKAYAGVHSNFGLIIRQASALNWSSSSSALSGSDLKLYRDAANTLGQRNSANAQTFNIYNTWTNAADLERVSHKWNSNVYEIASEALGSGTLRGIMLGVSGNSLGVLGATPVAQQSGTGETTGFAAGSGTAVNDDSTFTGNVGSAAYRINDVVKALKNYGLLAQ